MHPNKNKFQLQKGKKRERTPSSLLIMFSEKPLRRSRCCSTSQTSLLMMRIMSHQSHCSPATPHLALWLLHMQKAWFGILGAEMIKGSAVIYSNAYRITITRRGMINSTVYFHVFCYWWKCCVFRAKTPYSPQSSGIEKEENKCGLFRD